MDKSSGVAADIQKISDFSILQKIDGGLIGGASLKAPDFAVIVNAASNG